MTIQSLSELKVLLVEPSTVQGNLIRRECLTWGVGDVEVVETMQAAITALAESPDYNLVCSAMHLPDGTGSDLVHTLHSEDSDTYIPFILISSETGEKWLEPARQSGILAILPKPFTRDDLGKALDRVLDFHDTVDLDDLDDRITTARVLLVDDSRPARRHIRNLLASIGIANIDEAENGREAMNLLEISLYDLLITDYHMPDVNGLELLLHVRNNSHQPSLPAIVVSSDQSIPNSPELAAANPSGLLEKPHDPAELRQLLEQILLQDDDL